MCFELVKSAKKAKVLDAFEIPIVKEEETVIIDADFTEDLSRGVKFEDGPGLYDYEEEALQEEE